MAPLIATSIRVMYLGVMGWIGSLLTIRGVTIIAHAPQMPKDAPRKQAVAMPTPQEAKAKRPKEKVKPSEPEVIVIPPEQASQPQPPQNQQREKSSSQHSPNS
ncbi:MAG: hypothetical protein OEZ21_00895 [Candidatus Bathyarchaeota archaeon]|nr:hypothetical protein [Candidatus Bathyarchaeota archaeon]MDH5745498.1 hypothetical protein [Candidatus Bathyarchaeota archaeon]